MTTCLRPLSSGIGAREPRGSRGRPAPCRRSAAFRRSPAFRRSAARALAGAAILLAGLLLASPSRAGAATVTLLDQDGGGVSAYGGWAAWTHENTSANVGELMLRSPAGAVSTAAVTPNQGSFYVELGPVSGGVAAVYQRCTEPKKSLGCAIYELRLGIAGASEQRLAIPGGGSDVMPAIWNSRLAFVRTNPGHPKQPDRIYTWTIGSGSAHAVVLPQSRGGVEPEGGMRWPKGLTGKVTSLTLGSSALAYVTENLNGSFGETTLWYEPVGGRPELIDQETSGAGNVCPPAFLSPLISGPWLYAYLHACDPSGNAGLDRLTRYKHGEAQRAKYTFVHAGDDVLSTVIFDGAGVDWDDEGVRRLSGVSWRRIPLPVAQTFCTRSDPFC